MARKSARIKKAEAERIRLEKLKTWRDQEISRQSANRFQMQLDEDFYDGLQWDTREAAELLERGQAPVVYNEVKPTIDWLLGTERRTRIDFKVTPTASDKASNEDATNKTKLLKYLAEVNRSTFTRSHAFDEAVKAGLGWIEVGVKSDPEDEPIFDRAESWRNMLYDSLGTARDLSDSRYLFRMRWLDMDIAQAMFPEHEELIERAAESNPDNRGIDWWFGRQLSELDPPDMGGIIGGRWAQFDSAAWLHNPRRRVQCFEAWYYDPTTETTGLGSRVHDVIRMKMRCTVFLDVGILWDGWSPYRHNRFPFIPIWCYRRKRDGAPYGVIRNLRGPQESLNKRISKSLHILSTNQVHVEADAIDDEVMTADEIREELAAPDAFVQWRSGALSGKKVLIQSDKDLAAGHLEMAERDKVTIREVGGVTSENLGRDTRLVSGVALRAKHEQGSTVTAELFDNLRMSRQMEGEIKLSLIEQFYTEPKVFRITGERNKHDFVSINEPDPVTGEILNDVTARKAVFVIDEQDFQQSLMTAMFESLMDLLSRIAAVDPEFARNVLDIVIEYAPVHGKDALVKRIRELTGQVDPDEEDSPEKVAEREAAKELQARLQALNVAAMEADVAGKQAQAELRQAQAGESAARISKTEAERITKLLEGIYAALQAAQVVATVPGAAPVGDELLKSAGFQDQSAATLADTAPAQPMPGPAPVPGQGGPLPALPEQQTGMRAGIETPRGDDNVRM